MKSRLRMAVAGGALMLAAFSGHQVADAASAPRWYCSTTTAYGEACIPDTTTTAKPTTTTHVTYPTTTATTVATTLPSTTQFTVPTTIATTTTATTIATTTTAKQTTTTVPVTNPCPGSGCPQTSPPTTAVTTTVGQTTTTAATTTVAPPPPSDDFVVTTAAPAVPVTTTLPVTGASENLWKIALAGAIMLFVGTIVLHPMFGIRRSR